MIGLLILLGKKTIALARTAWAQRGASGTKQRLIRWLTKKRWRTLAYKAQTSPWMWDSDDRLDRYYTLSLLGVINGILPRLGWVLIVEDGQSLSVRKRWW